MPFRAHAGVGQNLGNRIFSCQAFFALIGTSQMLNIVGRMVKTDELDRIREGLDQVLFFDNGSHCSINFFKKLTVNNFTVYLPFQTCARLSANAVGPSLASSETEIFAMRGCCSANMSSRRKSCDCTTTCLTVLTARGPFAPLF